MECRMITTITYVLFVSLLKRIILCLINCHISHDKCAFDSHYKNIGKERNEIRLLICELDSFIVILRYIISFSFGVSLFVCRCYVMINAIIICVCVWNKCFFLM